MCFKKFLINSYFFSLYSGITANGSVSYNYSSTVTGSKSLQCKFEGNINYNSSVSSNITINNYLFYDTCSSSTGLSNYTQRTLESGTITASLTYDSSMNAYKIITDSGKLVFYGINSLNNLDNFILNAEIYCNSNSVGLAYNNVNSTGITYGLANSGSESYGHSYSNGVWQGTVNGTVNGSFSSSKWYTMTLKKTGNSIVFTLTDPDNSNNYNSTYTTTSSTSTYYGFTCYNGTTYIRNISAVSL